MDTKDKDKDYGCPTWLGLVEKWTQGDQSLSDLLAAWMGSQIVGRPDVLTEDHYRKLRDWFYDLGERDPEAISIIFRTTDELKEYGKGHPRVEELNKVINRIEEMK